MPPAEVSARSRGTRDRARAGAAFGRAALRDDGPVRLPIPVGPDTVTINRDDRVLVCGKDGRIDAGRGRGLLRPRHPLRVGLRPVVNDRRPVLLNSSSIEFYSSRFEFTNEALLDDVGPGAPALPVDPPRPDRRRRHPRGLRHRQLRPARRPPDDRDRDRVRLRRHLRRRRRASSSAGAASTRAGSGRAASCGRCTTTATSIAS